ncbi:MAG TPA: MarR family transcriptional regulator [Steroidobacteraceae bacterium]|nr:MarR family transcriptional regulator [Steroidobacteraceae bacterium]
MDRTDRFANLGFLLKDVSRLYARRFEERAHRLSLTLPQCKALAYLSKNEGVSQKRLAELLEIDPMSLVRILDRMEADGWVQRRSDPEDRRARSLILTDKAKPLLDQMWRLAAETRAEVLEGLSNAERTTLMELLERVHTNLQGLKPLPQAANASASGTPGRKSASPAR